METALIALSILLAGVMDIVPLVKKKQWKEFCTYIAILTVCLITGILLGLGVPIPSIEGQIKKIVSLFLSQ